MKNYIAFAEETKPTFIDFAPLNFLDVNDMNSGYDLLLKIYFLGRLLVFVGI